MTPGDWSNLPLALTDSAIKAAKPKASQHKLYGERGPLPIVRPVGGKLWRLLVPNKLTQHASGWRMGDTRLSMPRA